MVGKRQSKRGRRNVDEEIQEREGEKTWSGKEIWMELGREREE